MCRQWNIWVLETSRSRETDKFSQQGTRRHATDKETSPPRLDVPLLQQLFALQFIDPSQTMPLLTHTAYSDL